MKIPLIFQYKTEADHEALKRLKTFLDDSGCYVYEINSETCKPLWRYIFVDLQDGDYAVSLPHNTNDVFDCIVSYTHEDIIESLEEDDTENEEMIHGEIREIIGSITEDYFYPPEVAEKLF